MQEDQTIQNSEKTVNEHVEIEQANEIETIIQKDIQKFKSKLPPRTDHSEDQELLKDLNVKPFMENYVPKDKMKSYVNDKMKRLAEIAQKKRLARLRGVSPTR